VLLLSNRANQLIVLKALSFKEAIFWFYGCARANIISAPLILWVLWSYTLVLNTLFTEYRPRKK